MDDERDAELARGVEADVGEIMQRTGFANETTADDIWQINAEDLAVFVEWWSDANRRYYEFGMALGEALVRITEELKPFIARFVREAQRLGLISEIPPTKRPHSFRQTKYGRVPRLTSMMIERQRELRMASGRR